MALRGVKTNMDGWDQRPPCVDCVHLPSLSLLAQLLLLSLVSGLSFSLPFLLTPSDVFSRRSILLLQSALSLCGGLLLSASLLWALHSSLLLSLATEPAVPLSVCLLLFGCGLLTPPTIERSLLLVCGAWVRHRRLLTVRAAAEAALAEEQSAMEEAARLTAHRSGQREGKPQAASSAAAGANGARGSVSAAVASSVVGSRGRQTGVPSPLPPPIRDYRTLRNRPLEYVSDDDGEVDLNLDDVDQLSPALFPSTPLLPHSSLSASYYYSYPTGELDAVTFINERRYIARCLFCKDSVTTRKGLAFHAAGCVLKQLPAFTVHSHSLTALRGRRQLTLDDSRIPQWVLILIALTEQTIVGVLAGSAASVALRSSTLLVQLTAAVTLAAYCFLSALSVGLLLRQCRVTPAVLYSSGVLVTAPLPLSILLLSVWRGWLSRSVLVCAYGWLGGVLCWYCVVDCFVEELERREARSIKWLLFVSGFACIAALNAL